MLSTVSLKSLSSCVGVDESELLILNPELRRNQIPPIKNKEFYPLRVPLETPETFDSLFALLKEVQTDNVVFETHRVRSGESLWLIAKKYNIRIQDIVDANKLQNSRYIRPGQRLKIPIAGLEEWRKSSLKQSGKRKVYFHFKKTYS